MTVIILMVLQIIQLILIVRLNRCGHIVNVHQTYTYVPAQKKKKPVAPVSQDDDYE